MLSPQFREYVTANPATLVVEFSRYTGVPLSQFEIEDPPDTAANIENATPGLGVNTVIKFDLVIV